MCRHVGRYPQWVLAPVIPAWAFTAFAGAWTATKIGILFSFAIVGLMLLAFLVVNIAMLPYPLWFKIADLLAISAAISAAGRVSKRKKTQSIYSTNSLG